MLVLMFVMIMLAMFSCLKLIPTQKCGLRVKRKSRATVCNPWRDLVSIGEGSVSRAPQGESGTGAPLGK